MRTLFDTENMLRILVVFTILYALWVMCHTIFSDRKRNKRETGGNVPPPPKPETGEKNLMGKSKFVLEQSHSQPQATTPEKEDGNAGNLNTFVPSNVPEHPRQVPEEELDETFNGAPPDEENPPLDIDYPLSRSGTDDEDEEESEYLPVTGRQSLADGVSFEQMGDAFRTVVHNPKQTGKEKKETGRVLVSLKHTDMFEAVVSGNPGREDNVDFLINSYLAAFHKKQAAGPGENDAPNGKVPPDFDAKKFM